MARPERLLAAAPLVPSGPPSLRSGVNLGRRPSFRTRLVGLSGVRIIGDEPAASTGSSRSEKVMARPERFELPTSWFVARRSIQLSYGRNGARILPHRPAPAPVG